MLRFFGFCREQELKELDALNCVTPSYSWCSCLRGLLPSSAQPQCSTNAREAREESPVGHPAQFGWQTGSKCPTFCRTKLCKSTCPVAHVAASIGVNKVDTWIGGSRSSCFCGVSPSAWKPQEELFRLSRCRRPTPSTQGFAGSCVLHPTGCIRLARV